MNQTVRAPIGVESVLFWYLSCTFLLKTYPKLAAAEGGRERGRSKTIDGTSAILCSDRLPTGPIIPAASAEQTMFPRGLPEAGTRAVLVGVAVCAHPTRENAPEGRFRPKKWHSRRCPFQTLRGISDLETRQ